MENKQDKLSVGAAVLQILAVFLSSFFLQMLYFKSFFLFKIQATTATQIASITYGLLFYAVMFVIVVVWLCHFLFEVPYKKLGLNMSKLKKSTGLLLYAAAFILIVFAVTVIKGPGLDLSGYIITAALALVCAPVTAVTYETIYRGFILRKTADAFLLCKHAKPEGLDKAPGKLSKMRILPNEVILPVLITALLNMLSKLPDIIIRASYMHITWGIALPILIKPLLFGIYLGLLYCLTGNLWDCVILQTVYSGVGGLAVQIFKPFDIIGYGVIVILLLVYLAVVYRNHRQRTVRGAD